MLSWRRLILLPWFQKSQPAERTETLFLHESSKHGNKRSYPRSMLWSNYNQGLTQKSGSSIYRWYLVCTDWLKALLSVACNSATAFLTVSLSTTFLTMQGGWSALNPWALRDVASCDWKMHRMSQITSVGLLCNRKWDKVYFNCQTWSGIRCTATRSAKA